MTGLGFRIQGLGIRVEGFRVACGSAEKRLRFGAWARRSSVLRAADADQEPFHIGTLELQPLKPYGFRV